MDLREASDGMADKTHSDKEEGGTSLSAVVADNERPLDPRPLPKSAALTCIVCNSRSTSLADLQKHYQGKKHRASLTRSMDDRRKLDLALEEDEGGSAVTEGDNDAPPRLRRLECVLAQRTVRVTLVLEGVTGSNTQAILRTAECFGIQNVWIIEHDLLRNSTANGRVSTDANRWLSIRYFSSSTECIHSLREEDRVIWATDLSPSSIPIGDALQSQIPDRLAVVMGNEVLGVSEEFLEASARRLYIPIFGWCDSLNVGVATGILLNSLSTRCPSMRGDLDDAQRRALKQHWQSLIGNNKSMQQDIEDWKSKTIEPLSDLRRVTARAPFLPSRKLKRLRDSEPEAVDP